jgi:ATP-binding cassette subfamily F protein 1
MSSFAALEEKKPKKEKKEKKEKKSKKEKTDKERKAKKKKKKKDLLDKLASLPDADPNAISSGEECVQPDKTKAVTRSVIEAEYIPEEEVQSEEDVPVETEKERKKRIKKEKKEARRAAAAAAAAADSNNDGDEEEKSGETKSSGGSSETTKNKKEKKLTRKQKKQLELERSMKEMDKQIAVSSKFPFTISHCVQAIADKEAWKRSTDINIEEFTVAGTGAKGTQLFENAQLKIVAGRKYGLIGPNGMGKTTLLRLIHMKRLQIPPSIDFLMVEQEIEGSETRAIEAVLAADTKRASLMKKEQALLEELDARADVDDDDMDDESIAYGEKLLVDLEKVASELESIDASSAEPRARSILSGLGFTVEMQERATQKFSGGWRMRISLARALFINPTMLMLDEPTNHLDLNAVLWLDHYLRTWKGTLIVVSHDQDFLNNVVTDIIHLQERKLLYYKGNYEHFKLVSKQAFMDRVKAYEKQQKKLRQLKKNNTSGKKGDAKNQVVKKQREKGARSAKKAAKNAAASGGTSSESKNEELLTRPKEYTVNIVFPEPTELSPPIINVKDVSFRYGEGLPTLFTGVDFGLDMQSRVSMVGPNGVGKSTLLSLILGKEEEENSRCCLSSLT